MLTPIATFWYFGSKKKNRYKELCMSVGDDQVFIVFTLSVCFHAHAFSCWSLSPQKRTPTASTASTLRTVSGGSTTFSPTTWKKQAGAAQADNPRFSLRKTPSPAACGAAPRLTTNMCSTSEGKRTETHRRSTRSTWSWAVWGRPSTVRRITRCSRERSSRGDWETWGWSWKRMRKWVNIFCYY